MPIGSLWLPVVVSAVAVFVVSSILHMALKYHRADYRKLANEDDVAAVVRKASPGPGVYVMPYVMDPGQMKDPAVRKRYEDGPVALVTVLRNGPPNLAVNLTQWLGYTLLVGFVTAYVARHTLSAQSGGMLVMRMTGAVAFAGYGLGYVQDSIWKGIPWANSLRSLFDAAIYSVVTGLVFRWLWP